MIVRIELLNKFKNYYGETDMLCCYAQSQGVSAITQNVVLLVNREKVVILFVSFFRNHLVHKIEFTKNELSDRKIKFGRLLDDIWQFTARGQKWSFRIQRKIFTLGNRQSEFLDYLKENQFDC